MNIEQLLTGVLKPGDYVHLEEKGADLINESERNGGRFTVRKGSLAEWRPGTEKGRSVLIFHLSDNREISFEISNKDHDIVSNRITKPELVRKQAGF